MFRLITALVALCLVAAEADAQIFRGRSGGCANGQCGAGGCSGGPSGISGGSCAAPLAASTAPYWAPGVSPDERILVKDGKQIGGYYLPTHTYRPFADGKYGEPEKCPVARPSERKVHRQGLLSILIHGREPLDDLNDQRSARGLPPYQKDEALTAAAEACAAFRAEHRLAGHTQNDFAFLGGASSDCAGCAAWPQDMRFGSCRMFERRTWAGAASVLGGDGLVYHQLFVR